MKKLSIKVITRSRRPGVEERGDLLIVRVAEPPVDGQANKAVLKMLSKHLGTKQIEIESGKKSQRKRVLVRE